MSRVSKAARIRGAKEQGAKARRSGGSRQNPWIGLSRTLMRAWAFGWDQEDLVVRKEMRNRAPEEL